MQVRPRFAALVQLPLGECVPHLRGILRRLEAEGPHAEGVAGALRDELAWIRKRLAAREARFRRERVEDHFVLVRPDGARFVARRRQDQGEGWALLDPTGLFLGNHATLDACEAAASAPAAREG